MSKSDPESAIFMEDTVQEVGSCLCFESGWYFSHAFLASN